MNTNDDGQVGWRRRIFQIFLVALLLPVVAGLLVLWIWSGINSSGSESDPTAGSTQPQDPTPQPTPPGEDQSGAAVAQDETQEPPAPEVPEIVVKTQIAEPAGWGQKLGPDSYQLGENRGEADIAFSWTYKGGDNCRMRVVIEGPQDFPPVRTAECSGDFASGFSGSDNGVTVMQAGTYTVTATDELTGAAGSVTFTVEP